MKAHSLALLAVAAFTFRSATAVDPLPTLPELLKEYEALGLPFPPKDARLVRVRFPGPGFDEDGKVVPPPEDLAFEIKPATKTERAIISNGFYNLNESVPANWDLRPRGVKPDKDAIKGLEFGPETTVIFAIHCFERGWTEPAEALHKHYPESLKWEEKLHKQIFGENSEVPIPKAPVKMLEFRAWHYHSSQLSDPTADRSIAAKYIRELIKRDKNDDTEEMRAMLKSLDLALIPSKAKPGSIEALIDGLINQSDDPERYQSPPGRYSIEPKGSYLKLLELGFDAVPKLIDSMNDDRLTCASTTGFNNFWPWRLRVGDVAGDLLEGLAAEKLMRGKNGEEVGGGRLRRLQAWPITKAAAVAWWEKAQKVGEEQHALSHILPPQSKNNELTRVNMHLLRLISAKYPKHLPTLYRKVLEERPDLESDGLALALAASSNPTKLKLELLIQGTKHKQASHRLTALTAMKAVDQKHFDAHLIAAIEVFPKDSPVGYEPWEFPEMGIAGLAIETRDPKTWLVMEKVIRRSTIGLRIRLLIEMSYAFNETRWRTERLKLFAAFLDDTDFRDLKSDRRFENSDQIEVRNYAAFQLAEMLDMEIRENPKRTPEEWAKIRENVRAALKRELEKKP